MLHVVAFGFVIAIYKEGSDERIKVMIIVVSSVTDPSHTKMNYVASNRKKCPGLAADVILAPKSAMAQSLR